MNNFNFTTLPSDKIREVVKDMVGVETSNVAVCTLYKGTVTIFNDRLRATSHEPVYFIVPNDYKKNEQGSGWVYDISKFQIYKLTRDNLTDKGYDPDFLPDDKTKIVLDDSWLVYSSKNGLPKEATEFTLREQACLLLKIPSSGTLWLDNLIKESIR